MEDAQGDDTSRMFATSELTDYGVGDTQHEDAAREQSLMLGPILFLMVVAAQSARWIVVIGLVAQCCLGHFTSVLWQPGIGVTALLVLGGRARCTRGPG